MNCNGKYDRNDSQCKVCEIAVECYTEAQADKREQGELEWLETK